MNQFPDTSRINRLSALQKGEKKYEGSPCKNCISTLRYVCSSGCVRCQDERNIHKLTDGTIDKYHSKENDLKRLRAWRKNNPEKVKTQRDRAKIYQTQYQSKRRATVKHQTITGADQKLIQEFYIQAVKLTKNTGIPHEVDHIIPICKGGFHHQDNLRVITRSENRKKGGKLCV